MVGPSGSVGVWPESIADGVAEAVAFVGGDEAVELVVVPGGLPELVAEERVERRRQLARDVVVVADQQSAEEGEVEVSSELVGRVAVGGVAVADEQEALLEVGLGGREVVFDFGQAVALSISRVSRSCSLLSRSIEIASA